MSPAITSQSTNPTPAPSPAKRAEDAVQQTDGMQTKLQASERLQYEQEIKSLKQRIEREELQGQEQKKKFEELQNTLAGFQQLAKNQMNNTGKAKHESPVRSSLLDESSTPQLASPSSIYQQFETFKHEKAEEIAALKHLLDEERSKTNRYDVLKMERDELQTQLAAKSEQIKKLEMSLCEAERSELDMAAKLEQHRLESQKQQ
ncbi:hypothetical protein HDU91_004076, partial [Kappamyces sp. JEL0680]